MGRVGALAFFLGLAGVTGAIFDPYGQVHLGHWRAQVAFDVGCQRFERRDVEGVQTLVRTVAELCQCRQEPGKGFAATRGSDQQQGGVIGAFQHLLLVRVDGPALGSEPV